MTNPSQVQVPQNAATPGKKASTWMAEQIANAGVSHVFFLEAILRDTLNELRRMGVRTILPHTEKAAAYMADGYARVAGKPGLCWAQSVGAANLAAGLQDAWLARTPLIAITGRKPVADQDRNPYQEIDHAKAFSAVTRHSGNVTRAEDLPRLLANAWRTALAGVPRPVHLDVAGLMAEYLEPSLLDDANVPADLLKGITRPVQAAAAHQLERAAAAIRGARKVVIVAGSDALAAGAGPAILALASQLGAPVATTVGARAIIATTHPLAIGTVGSYGMAVTNRVVHEADLVLVVGAQLSDQNTHAWRIPAARQGLVQIDADATEAGRVYPNAVPVIGDPRLAVEALAPLLENYRSDEGFARQAELAMQAWRREVSAMQTSGETPIRVERLCAEIGDVLPDDGILVADTGYSAIWSCTHIEYKARQTYLRAAGSLGWSFPAALGAKCAAPDRKVVCFNGDGAFYYHMAEIETALRYDLPITVVINNNSGFGQDACNMVAKGMPIEQVRALAAFEPTDFAAIARSFGANGVRVTEPGQLQGALQDAMSATRLTVVDVATDFLCRAPDPWAPAS
ncbi:Acetolactate synthase large subunit [Variovorax sp. PBL-H6]|uniref:thiamine pyrophosphate-binding protein n=1 Tax=Variovorax sp. PBL-H6 TaxID=434009 RepID=UPI001316A21D|nr:thiamine pyrophosphate-binding protein [Variovorax sp. PBL-H6]VTU23075.1 Acetolactate synthase large subunit [Variovorax sp. PBL-H6]